MIDKFFGEHRFLSNFWPAEVTLDGETFPSVEHAYQAAKFLVPATRQYFMFCSAGEAKKKAKRLPFLREDWEDVKVGIMKALVQEKFTHPHLREWLLNTGDQELVEGNTWGDTFWGICKGKGENRLGKILMEVREECRG